MEYTPSAVVKSTSKVTSQMAKDEQITGKAYKIMAILSLMK